MVGKMPTSKVESPAAAVKLVSLVVLAPRPDAVTELRPARRMPTFAGLPLLQVVSDEEDKEVDEEKEASEGSGDHGGDESSSSSEGSSSDGTEDDDGDEDEEVSDEDTMVHCDVDSVEIGLAGEGIGEDREVDSHARDIGAIPRCRRVHIMREGWDVPTAEDENDSFTGKRPLGEASHGSLRHFANAYGFDDPNI